jgi:DNA-binding transcriptional MerR regulator
MESHVDWSIEHTLDPDLFSIRQMADAYGVTMRALRFYEGRGLIAPVRRGSARFYDAATRARLQLILKGKQFGFTLAEISEMLASHEETRAEAGDLALGADKVIAQLDYLERQRQNIDRAITELRATHQRLAMTPGAIPAAPYAPMAAAQ